MVKERYFAAAYFKEGRYPGWHILTLPAYQGSATISHVQQVRDKFWQWGNKYVAQVPLNINFVDKMLWISDNYSLADPLAESLSVREVYDRMEMYLRMME